MDHPLRSHISLPVALLLAVSAILLFSCKSEQEVKEDDVQNMLTQQSENLTLIYSQNGNLSYRFETPLLERYQLAHEPYMEFRKGVKVETYNDSTHRVDATLTANYAIFLENQQLWEAKGNVIATNATGQKLETEQLFWNQKSGRIYSNVDSKVTQGEDVIIGEGFESDEQFTDYTFRRPKGKVAVDVAPGKAPADSTAGAAPGGKAVSGEPSEPAHPVIREGEAVARPKP